jgi:TPR repeat protein
MLELGERLLHGNGVDTSTAEGISWIRNSADAGNGQAWYALGVVYANAVGVETDMERALGCFLKGAALANADCQASMGLFYQAGDKVPGGVKADLAEARRWYMLAAGQNHEEAILHLGQLLMFGQGGAADPPEAARWWRKGAELGSAESQWSLGQCYLNGKGVAKDPVQAYALFAAASEGASDPNQKKGMSEQAEKLAKELSPEQLSKAKSLTQEWKAKGKK